MTTSPVRDHDQPSSGRGSRLIATPTDPEEASGALWQEVRHRFAWYDRAANRNRWAYYAVKLMFLVGGAGVTVLAAISAPAMITAILAGSIVVLEGIQQLFRFHSNWISYRATAETIRCTPLRTWPGWSRTTTVGTGVPGWRSSCATRRFGRTPPGVA